MLIPLGHERMSARRWPIITFALIAINVGAFLATHGTMSEESADLGQTRVHIMLLAAMHPELEMPEDVQEMVDTFREHNPGLWKEAQLPTRDVADEWDARMRIADSGFQAEMDKLTSHYQEIAASSITEQYAFTPAHPKPIAYLTANFLHGGWLHLIGNMWFLWLAGFVLEDVWGRVVYSVVYLLAGAAALQFHALTTAGSMTPTLGASGAVAALMGAFLVRFPTTNINMGLLLRFRLYRFKMAAYWLLPFWVLMEIFYGTIFGTSTGVAHWAHVGGFAFGAAIAGLMKISGLENKLNAAVESQVTLTSDPEISQATDFLSRNEYDEAIAVLQNYLATKPNSAEGYLLLQQAFWRKGDVSAYQDAAIKCCAAHLKAREFEPAWQNYEEFLGSGGEPQKVPPATWLELGRAAESQQMDDRALAEYEKLIAAYPAERQSLQAQLAAAKLCSRRLGRPQDALQFYQAAAASRVPHLDLEPVIDAGIRDTRAALASGQALAATAQS